ncbi:MAG: hypothetical protein M3279_11050, partial [Actinomycetota bacterium]|nr:hypothetical protein [Actinomycetota bacterium]
QPQLDVAVRSENNQAAIMAGHWPMPAGATKEQLGAGMSFAQQYMPRFPGVTMGAFQESTAVSGEGVFAYEMSATANGKGLVPGGSGRMRLVFAAREGAPSFVLLVVACAEAECASAEAEFQKMATTLEISS